MSEVAKAWDRIHRWLAQHAPKILGNLNPGATADAVSAAERTFGLEMPDEWRELYRLHNGMNDEGNFGSLFCGMKFLSLDRAIDEYSEISGAGKEYEPLVVRASDAGVQTRDMHNPRWIALCHDGGSTLLRADMDPTIEGKHGQVIFTDHDDDVAIVLAPSIAQFMWNFVEDLEKGRYFLAPDALDEGDQFLNCAKEIDVVNWSFSPKWEYLRKQRYPAR